MDLLNNPPLLYLLKNLHPINKYSKLALEFVLRIQILLHSDWSKNLHFVTTYNWSGLTTLVWKFAPRWILSAILAWS